ncbi:hypothetical protein OIE66_40575 [Nonomuraea sp. NBC_01738]|uniref:hypothetical protein n=1 Tax=Nonomuraea sp. NBC_01738 TaxID=2976003 RepID=UPI002E0FC708|nr:hypothetical protein OIE66_40575 [Nonomuraea sp. NBC_01738]
MTQEPIWPDLPRPRRGRRWTPRCDDCGRRIWSAEALHRRFGLLLGDTCHRRRVRAARRLIIPIRIPVRPPGDIPGQIAITDQEPA